jgi:general stress protein 26
MALTWREIADRLTGPRLYWLHTTKPDGAPHAAPMWGVVLDQRFYLYTERSSVKARNVQRDPRVLVHLEDGGDVLMVYGVLTDLGPPGRASAVVDAFDAKYDEAWERPFLPRQDPAFDVLYVLDPDRAITWTLPDSAASTRRWTATTR